MYKEMWKKVATEVLIVLVSVGKVFSGLELLHFYVLTFAVTSRYLHNLNVWVSF